MSGPAESAKDGASGVSQARRAAAGSAAVLTDGLTKSYRGTPVVDNLSLTVPAHGVYGFLGRNGAGKSTTMKMLLGLTDMTSGSAQVLGCDVRSERSRVLSRTGSLIEGPSFYGHLTGLQNMEIVRKVRGAVTDSVELLADLGIVQAKDRRVREYSLGMKQRLGIAMALVGEPQLLILDEPTNGLDPAGIHEVREMIQRFPSERGLTVLISSHLLSEISQVADTVGIIHQGKLVFEGPLSQLRGRSEIVFRTSDDAVTRSVLASHGLSLDPGTTSIPWVGDEEVNGVVRELVSRGVGVHRVEGREESLEDVFLRLTGEQNKAVDL